MNLTKRLATAGVASRRKAAELIKNGEVTVNGKVETNPATLVSPSDKIRVEGSAVAGSADRVYIMLNKPRGYVCTNEDPHAKKKAIDLIRLHKPVRLFSAGRLDKDSEGLIIFTNDGKFADRLTHPRNEIFKTYALSAERSFTDDELQQMVDGIEDDGETLSAEEVWQTGERKFMIVLAEGRNRGNPPDGGSARQPHQTAGTHGDRRSPPRNAQTGRMAVHDAPGYRPHSDAGRKRPRSRTVQRKSPPYPCPSRPGALR